MIHPQADTIAMLRRRVDDYQRSVMAIAGHKRTATESIILECATALLEISQRLLGELELGEVVVRDILLDSSNYNYGLQDGRNALMDEWTKGAVKCGLCQRFVAAKGLRKVVPLCPVCSDGKKGAKGAEPR